jgi:hypothetical protein
VSAGVVVSLAGGERGLSGSFWSLTSVAISASSSWGALEVFTASPSVLPKSVPKSDEGGWLEDSLVSLFGALGFVHADPSVNPLPAPKIPVGAFSSFFGVAPPKLDPPSLAELTDAAGVVVCLKIFSPLR